MVRVLSRAHNTCHTSPLHYSIIHSGPPSMVVGKEREMGKCWPKGSKFQLCEMTKLWRSILFLSVHLFALFFFKIVANLLLPSNLLKPALTYYDIPTIYLFKPFSYVVFIEILYYTIIYIDAQNLNHYPG